MDQKTLKALQDLVAHTKKPPASWTQTLDKSLDIATKTIALAALITALLTDVATNLLPALDILLRSWTYVGAIPSVHI